MIELFYVLEMKFNIVHKNAANSIQFHFMVLMMEFNDVLPSLKDIKLQNSQKLLVENND